MNNKDEIKSFGDIFTTLDNKEIKILEKFIEEKLFPKGIPLTAEGNPADGIYIIKSGIIEITKQKGQKIEGELKTGKIFGEISFLFDTPQNATLYTKEECRLMYLKKEQFEIIKKKYPELALKMVLELAKKLYLRLTKQ
ncbi:MAG TPA: cyclic nucleotide-binding domain-containing protein [bacterium]|nr:cyclic nucleotide-binding domain-containing protein [bacterium]HOL48038.1 cyclic nucleotide-binding domain-containing protein [bacterium]HPQ19770.1 cyclic nucleotide-binding domain-containing protein [bacterium]